MYLMLDHNEEDWTKFIRFIMKYKLYYVCCQCGSTISKHFNDIDTEEAKPRTSQTQITQVTKTEIAMSQVIAK